MNVSREILLPRMEDRGHGDGTVEMPRVVPEREERVGGRAKEEGVEHAGIALGQRVEVVRQREDDVKVRNRQEVRLLRGEPAFLRRGLAFGAVAIAAGKGELSITCLMESASFWGARVSSRFHTLDLRPIRHAMHSP